MSRELVNSLLGDDVEEALRLSTQAGWNQTKEDWKRLRELNPESCFLFHLDDKVVGSATLITFGRDLCWIGMVIVDISYRGMGIGKNILNRVLDLANSMECRIIGLDATTQGRRLYKKFGFHDVERIDRWSGQLKQAQLSKSVEVLNQHHIVDLLALDFKKTGIDRSKLIGRFIDEKKIIGLGVNRDDELKGFLFLRCGREFKHIGPVVAETENDYLELLDSASHLLNGKQVLIDVIRRKNTSNIMKRSGLKLQRELTRMTMHKPFQVLQQPEVYAIVSFEWG